MPPSSVSSWLVPPCTCYRKESEGAGEEGGGEGAGEKGGGEGVSEEGGGKGAYGAISQPHMCQLKQKVSSRQESCKLLL